MERMQLVNLHNAATCFPVWYFSLVMWKHSRSILHFTVLVLRII